MTAVLLVSQDAIMMLRAQAYQRGAAQAAVCVASSFGLQGVGWRYGENGHCDISQVQTQEANVCYERRGEIACLRPAFH